MQSHDTVRPGASDMTVRDVDRAASSDLERTFGGTLIWPHEPSYDHARRIWNGSIDRYPGVIARCTSDEDIKAALAFVRRTGSPVAVRAGGHSFPGLSVCDGGVVIDLRQMHDVHVDPSSGLVDVEPGALLGELDAATQAHGMAVPVGAVTHTGVAGLTLGGGIGWLMRKHGLTIDQLRAVEMLTAGGERVRASAHENAELFWGLRGGGGNLGIVTRFRFQAHAVGPTILAGILMWPLDQGGEVGRFYRDWSAEAPDELMTALVLRKAPALDFIPLELREQPVAAVVCSWVGEPAQGADVMRPMRAFGSPLFDGIEPRPYMQLQSMLDPSFPPGLWAYVKACDLDRLDDEIIDLSVAHAKRIDSPQSGVIFWQLGGAVARAGDDETAFGSRRASHIANITGATMSAAGFESERSWTQDFYAELEPHGTSVYVNFLMEEGPERVRQAYGAERYARLSSLKRRYDPGNVLHLNQNIQPE